MKKRSEINAPKALGLAVLAVLAAGCETGAPSKGAAARTHFASGSLIGAQLSRADEAALAQAFIGAVEEAKSGESRAWTGASASGEITARGYYFANLRSDPRALVEVDAPLSFAAPVEIEQGDFVLAREGNVRAGPTTKAAVLEKLAAGVGVEGLAKIAGGEWILVGVKARARGYVHQSLLVAAPGADLALAGGPTRRIEPCRGFEQKLSVGGRSDRFRGIACKRGESWTIEPRDPNAPVSLF